MVDADGFHIITYIPANYSYWFKQFEPVLCQIRKTTNKLFNVAKKYWKGVPHLMQQQEIPRKGFKISKLVKSFSQEYSYSQAANYNKSLIKVDLHED